MNIPNKENNTLTCPFTLLQTFFWHSFGDIMHPNNERKNEFRKNIYQQKKKINLYKIPTRHDRAGTLYKYKCYFSLRGRFAAREEKTFLQICHIPL